MTNPFRRATRSAVKLKVGVDGPPGSGKTEGMLAILTGITGGGRIAVADSENESASYYADRYTFDSVPLDAKSTPATVIQVIDDAVAHGYDALGIDSLSRVWQNLLNAKDQYTLQNPSANHWAAWGLPQFGPGWERLMKHLLDAPLHIVATMRSKITYEQVQREGKTQILKLGLQPQVRDGTEYEFGLVFSVNMAHRAEATKDRTHLFATGELLDLRDDDLHQRLIRWMNTETPASAEAVAELRALVQNPAINDLARKEVQKLVAQDTPSADKVQRYRDRLIEIIATASAAAAAQQAGGQ